MTAKIKTYAGRKPRSEEDVQTTLRMLRGGAFNWSLTSAVMLVLSHLTQVSFVPTLVYFTIGISYIGIFAWMVRSRVAERFADPTLSFPQLVIAAANHALAMWLVPGFGIFFLINIFQVFAFGLFTLRAEEFRRLLLLTGALVLAVILHRGGALSFPLDSLAGQVLLFLVFFHALWRVVGVGNRVGALQRKVRRENAALTASEARFRDLTELSSDWYWERDADGRYTRFESGRGTRIAPKGSLIGKQPGETGFEIEYEGGWAAFKDLIDARQEYRDIVLKKKRDQGGMHYLSVSGMPVYGPDGEFAGYRGVSRDITEQRLAAERIEYLATHDGLTGLPNRFLFNQLLSMALQTARRQNRRFAVMFVDLDRFKAVNDGLGHHAGDDLLKTVAQRMKDALRAADVVARIGGDEFAVLVQEVDNREQLAVIAGKLLAAAAQPVTVAGERCEISASIGIAIYPEHGSDKESLLKNGDIAMYLAKEAGRNAYQFFYQEGYAPLMRRRDMEAHLRGALQRGEFSLCYQPRRDLKSGRIVGVEALPHWESPDLGPVPPAQFLPLAEETGTILALGRWVLHNACIQAMAWQRDGLQGVGVSINISSRQFGDEALLDDVAHALRDSGLPPGLLELALPEAVVFREPAKGLRTMRSLKELGVALAIGGFGGSYGSLRDLGDFPLDTLKVDRAIICTVGTDAQGGRLAEALLAVARALDVQVVAEAVETEEQESLMRAQLWGQVQGVFVGQPLAGEALLAQARAAASGR